MNDEWRQLLYPLGLFSSIAFSLRFLLQWILSEKQKKSIVTASFWQISLAGNLALIVHAFIQVQFHVCFVQTCNAVLSWRNLNLMQPKEQHYKRSTVVWILAVSLATLFSIFLLQSISLGSSTDSWFRIPTNNWTAPASQVALTWHIVGFFGLLLFNSRFWIQWWGAEKSGKSTLGPLFWWMSLSGAILCMTYFFLIADFINILGPLFGIVPYIRNLMIIRKSAYTVNHKSL